jgi:hypothetical protein
MKSPLPFTVALAVAALPFLVRPQLLGGDEPHYAVMAASLAFDRDTDVADEYRDVAAGTSFAAGRRFIGKTLDPHLVETPRGPHFAHPLGLPILAVPVLLLGDMLGLRGYPDLALGLLSVGLSLAALPLLATMLWCGTPLWFYGRTFFTEPYLVAFGILAAGMLARSRFVAAGALMGAMLVVKEAALLIVVALLVAAWQLGGRPALRRAAIGPALAAVLFVVRNRLVYGGGAVEFPQPFQRGDWLAGSAGTLIDPAHGLLLFAPLVLCTLVGWFSAREPGERRWALLSLLLVAAWWQLVAVWVDWRGGSCFGPRLLVPVLPALAIPLAAAWRRAGEGGRRALMLLAALGAGIEIGAIASPLKASWSAPLGEIVARNAAIAAVALLGAAAAYWLFDRSARSRLIR